MKIWKKSLSIFLTIAFIATGAFFFLDVDLKDSVDLNLFSEIPAVFQSLANQVPEGSFSVEALNPFEEKTCLSVTLQMFKDINKIIDKLDSQGIEYKGKFAQVTNELPEGKELKLITIDTTKELTEMNCEDSDVQYNEEVLYQAEIIKFRTQHTLSSPYWICKQYYDEGKTEILKYMTCDYPSEPSVDTPLGNFRLD